MRRSGALKGQWLTALEAVKRFPGHSSKELAALSGLDRPMLGRRLPELRNMGYVRVTQTGNEDQKWWAV